MNLSISTLKKIAVGAVGLGTIGLSASPVFASTATANSLTPPSTEVVATLPSGTDLTVATTVVSIPVTATCTSMKLKGETPADGLTIKVPKVHTISGCTDSYGSVTAANTGTWKLVWKSGTAASLVIPKSGAAFTDATTGCVVTLAPSTPATMAGKYSSGKLKISGDSVPTSYSGGECASSPGTSTATVTVTLKFNPALTVKS